VKVKDAMESCGRLKKKS